MGRLTWVRPVISCVILEIFQRYLVWVACDFLHYCHHHYHDCHHHDCHCDLQVSRNAEMRRSAASSPSCSDICWNPDLAMIDLDDDDLDAGDLDDGDLDDGDLGDDNNDGDNAENCILMTETMI